MQLAGQRSMMPKVFSTRVCQREIESQDGGAPKTAENAAGGWRYILSGLKTLLETGEPLTS
jgi:hypothetical protein